MCLAVYLGTNVPLEMPADVARGSLGIELATWTPPPLSRNHKYVYYLGQKAETAELACSCLLLEHVNWTETAPIVTADADELCPEDAPCPFEQLRVFCAAATAGGDFATIVCDDGGGQEQVCSEEDYGSPRLVRVEHVARGHLMFAETSGGIPWGVWHVVNAK